MENIALSDSNDDLANEMLGSNNQTRPPPGTFAEQQQVATELQDAANTDVTRGIEIILNCIFFLTSFVSFKLHFSVLVIRHLNLSFQHRVIQHKCQRVVRHYYFNRK